MTPNNKVMDCHPPGKKKKRDRQVHHSLSPDTQAIARHLQDMDSDYGDYGDGEWNPHTGTKPSPLDGEASDEEMDPNNEVEDVESEVFNDWMVKMMIYVIKNGSQRPRKGKRVVSQNNALNMPVLTS